VQAPRNGREHLQPPDCRGTAAEIGARLGVGEERSRELEREALHRLRSMGDGRLARRLILPRASPVE
jgi:DNA-directed RNA polymerase sigma subunit (sigma70/sigma32)